MAFRGGGFRWLYVKPSMSGPENLLLNANLGIYELAMNMLRPSQPSPNPLSMHGLHKLQLPSALCLSALTTLPHSVLVAHCLNGYCRSCNGVPVGWKVRFPLQVVRSKPLRSACCCCCCCCVFGQPTFDVGLETRLWVIGVRWDFLVTSIFRSIVRLGIGDRTHPLSFSLPSPSLSLLKNCGCQPLLQS